VSSVRIVVALVLLTAFATVARAQVDGDQLTTEAASSDSAPAVPALAPIFANATLAPADPPQGTSAAQAPKPPKPEHTGFAALATETLADFKAWPRRESTWVILGAGGALALAVHPFDDDVNRHLVSSSKADKLWKPASALGGVGMAVAPIGIYLVGRYLVAEDPDTRTNKWSHLGFDLVRAQIVNEAFVQAIKYSVQRTRPNGSNYSFPSGHAAATFAFASVFERHLGYRFAWPTVVFATYVATSRLHDNVHFLSDVVFGAALGTTVGWTVVGRHGRENFALTPVVVPGGFAFQLARVQR
jgi:membrane-associated phospholipid phosphatase